ncbi:MAG TPA: uracil-DNA glycosylase [Pirellulales bacterium]|nr:uracil-DNA glycosylase [Pirellulales bacterium]
MSSLPAKQTKWTGLNRRIIACQSCPRLRNYCRRIAQQKRRAFAQWDYWGRPVPNFGHFKARLLVIGLAPAAHGGNRTGRMFTGDRSGDWLYRALFNAGFANQPQSVAESDGLRLIDCAITAAVHCAPPDNKPMPRETANCQKWLDQTVDLLNPQVMLALGQIAFRAAVAQARRRGWFSGPLPKFGHGAIVPLHENRWLLASYHPSQQNTFTGKLTEAMFDRVFATARKLLAAD